ncbi:MAG: chromosome segregation protein SMC [Clostridia bacterium]|nr:chromosome segregation protein SMC [Clostridia bacterium]
MYLKSLEMQGFKSFPDKTKLEFGKGMTAVVGPNGSGKSNIADAVKWVLGEQSTKSLRGAKMEDVVFSGTRARRAQGFAEVTLRLDNSDRKLSKDSDEVAVTRRFYRSGESEYKINGESVRLRDIHELFMDTGLGRDGYSMVSQGRIEDMVSAKSEDRREMFEEAAGISHYRYRRADALKRLSQAEENLLRLRDILTGLEERVGPLEKQSEKAQKFLAFAAERKNLEIGIWLDILEKSADLIREQSNKYTVAQMHYQQIEKDLETIITSSEEAAENIRNINIDIDNISRSIHSTEEEVASVESLIAVNKNSISHNNATVERIEKEKAQENMSSAQIDEQIEKTKASIEQLNALIAEKKASVDTLNGTLNSLRSRDVDVADEYVKISDMLAQLAKSLSEANIRYSAASSSLEEIESRRLSVEDEIKAKESEIKALNGEVSACESDVEEHRQKISEFTNTVSGYMIRVKSKAQKLEQHRFTVDKAKLDLEQKKSRVHMLQEMQKNMDGYQGSVKAVMKASSNGQLRGIHGPLSQLISVPDTYSLAIETALGAAIQHIVTENSDNAKKAMYYLKDNRLGRATFFPMDALRSRELHEDGLEDCDGYIDIASNIVKYDSKYSDIIGSQLGKTVIAEDIDSAVAIAKKYKHRFKIVTLDGQVVNAGGSMTGGSKIEHSGFLSRANEIERLISEIETDTAAVEELEKQLKKVKEDYSADNAALEGAKGDLIRAQEDKIKADSALSLAQSKKSIAEKALKALSDETLTAAERVKQLKIAIDEAQKEAQAVEKEMESYRKKSDELSGDRQNLSAERDKINEQISAVNLEIVAFMRDIENHTSGIADLEDRKNGQSDRIGKLDKEIAEALATNEKLNNRIAELTAKSDELRKSIDDAKAKTAALTVKREFSEKRSAELRVEERSKTEEKEKLSAELVRLEEKKNSLEVQQEETESKLFEEYKLTRREATELDIQLESIPDAKKRLAEIKNKIKALGSVNVGAIDEYKEVSERYEFMKTQLEDVEKSKAELNKLIYSLTDKMAVQFRERFDIINANFKETFAQLFGGGSAELILEDENDILECGIEIKAQPPGKNVKSLTLLSGGEKGLCAIALLFSILKVTPSPFCIFDEVEAALDDVNVLRYARYLKNMTERTQFILITHRRGTMEEADMLYGVTMQEKGVSKLLQLKTAQMAQDLGLEE